MIQTLNDMFVPDDEKLARMVYGLNKNIVRVAPVVRMIRVNVRRPYTSITLVSDLGRVGIGFSKCNPSDTWNPEYGIRLAYRRAVHDYITLGAIEDTIAH